MNFGRHFLGHHYYILSLSDQCLGVKKKNFKEIMHFSYCYGLASVVVRRPLTSFQELLSQS